MIRPFVMSFTAFLLLSEGASAQRVSEIASGARVRITPAHGKAVVGTVVSSSPDSITLIGGKSSVQLRTAVGDMKTVEISNGRNRVTGALVKGALGMGIGMVAGAALGAASYSEPERRECTPQPGSYGFDCLFAGTCWVLCSRGETATLAGILGGGAGLVIGTVMGAVTGRESWTSVKFR